MNKTVEAVIDEKSTFTRCTSRPGRLTFAHIEMSREVFASIVHLSREQRAEP